MSSYKEGQVHQLMERLEKEGFTAADITRLGQFKNLPGILAVLHGRSKIVADEQIIDCDKDPHVPKDWKVEEHIKGGQFKWNLAAIDLYFSETQKKGIIIGDDFREELKDKPVLNANVLDYLLANPHLIPEEWKGKFIFFWGTIYRDADDNLCVRSLTFASGRWLWEYNWLNCAWDIYRPAALACK